MSEINFTQLDEDVERFEAPLEQGLTEEQVEVRRTQNLTNRVKSKNSKTYGQIICSNVFTFFNLLSLIIAVAVIWVGSYGDAFFMVIILANTLIGIIQEIRSKHTIDKLSLVSAPTADVVRGGQRQQLSSSELVLDDVMLLESGRQICADAVVLSGTVEANEALLTGETIPIKKTPGCKLYAGSFVTAGNCAARVERVGAGCYVQQLSQQAKKYKKPHSELMSSLNRMIKIIGVIILPIAILMFNNNFSDNNWFVAITRTAGSIIGMIPAGMFLLTSVALAVGVIKLAKRKTLVQDLYCIEMLARANMVCLDKTGTITDGDMTVSELIELQPHPEPLNKIISSILYETGDQNMTANALAYYFERKNYFTPHTSIPFSSARKYSAASFSGKGTYVMGASEFIPHRASSVLDQKIEEYADQGYRVLLLAHSDSLIEGDEAPDDCIPIALILMEDHIREDAYDTINHFKENGVQLKVISGDNPRTVSSVARRAGIEGAEAYLNLDGLSDQEVADAALKYNVFGRVTPDQKAILIRALKAGGYTVAMTGDGVNDILAMKEADCSIAMAEGSEAARNVAHLVLLDSDFSSMPEVVYEGRRVINNVQKSSSLFLMKTFFSMILSLIFIFAGQAYPFSPKQLILIELFVIGLPSFFLALQPNNKLVKGKFLPTIIRNALPGSIVMVCAVCFVYFSGNALGIEGTELRALCVVGLTYVAFVNLLLICIPLNLYRTILVSAMFVAITLAIEFVPQFFEIELPTERSMVYILIMMAAAAVLYYAIKFLLHIIPFPFFQKKDVADEELLPKRLFTRTQSRAERRQEKREIRAARKAHKHDVPIVKADFDIYSDDKALSAYAERNLEGLNAESEHMEKSRRKKKAKGKKKLAAKSGEQEQTSESEPLSGEPETPAPEKPDSVEEEIPAGKEEQVTTE